MLLLRRSLRTRIGRHGDAEPRICCGCGAAALTAAALAWAVKLSLPAVHPIVVGIAVLSTYGVAYAGGTLALRVPEAISTLRRVLRR